MGRLLLLVLLSVAAIPATAATLRPQTTLTGPVVRLSDLFDDAGPASQRVLGPGPVPGGRIVVEAAQLAAIARQFGVEWRPASPADRAVLDRPGRMLPREQVIDALRSALEAAGAPAGCDIELPGFASPLVPAESTAQPVATQMDYDAASSRFTAILSVTGDGMAPINMRLGGRALETLQLPVAAERLMAGTLLRASDIRVARIRASLVRSEVARLPADAIGRIVRHTVPAGQPLPLADLDAPPLVQKGAIVLIQLDSPGLTLTGQGQALEPGAIGQRIRVLNPSSRAVIEAEVIGPNRVRVEPDAIPLVPPPRGRAQVAFQ
ncbi:MAG: flagellar basal body P-ring formation protein FlgA [Acetobacteraceae bacterium]|nr:flagellar basal body P-ring formation protein FlgA [Acetobacteraceae bacterium]